MRVAIFAETFLPKYDGITNTLCHLLEHLERRGHEGMMIAPQGAPQCYAGARICGYPGYKLPWYPDLKLVVPRKGMGREVLEFDPDVVHIASPVMLGLLGLRRARQLDAPVVASYHTDVPGYTAKYGLGIFQDPLWSYFRWLHNQADLNLCPSKYTYDELVRHGFERVGTWGRGVDTQRFSPTRRDATTRYRLSGGHSDAPLLVYVGRLAVEKRIDLLRPLLDHHPECRLAIVGSGPQQAELERLFAGTKTVFTGYLEGDDLAAAYASGDGFVFGGEHETLGNVVLEAMASGLPVLAAAIGGPLDHVRDGENGFLFPAGDPNALSERVGGLIGNPLLRRTLGEGARRYALTQTWEKIMDGLLDNYAALAGRRRSRTAARVAGRMAAKVA